jgi:hypothetical protein
LANVPEAEETPPKSSTTSPPSGNRRQSHNDMLSSMFQLAKIVEPPSQSRSVSKKIPFGKSQDGESPAPKTSQAQGDGNISSSEHNSSMSHQERETENPPLKDVTSADSMRHTNDNEASVTQHSIEQSPMKPMSVLTSSSQDPDIIAEAVITPQLVC